MARNKKAEQKADPSGARRTGVLTNPIRNMVISALVCVVLGVAFLVWPQFVYDYCGYATGGLLCLIGAVYIIIYFVRKSASGVYRSEFAVGLVALSAGGWMIFASCMPDATGVSISLRLIVTTLGVLLIGDGILKLQYTMDLARMHFRAWWVGLILSLLGAVLGVLTAMGFVDSLGVRLKLASGDLISAMLLLGVAFCCNAALDMGTMILVAVRNRKAAREEAVPIVAEPVAPSPAPGYRPVPTPAAPPAPAAPAAAPEPVPAAPVAAPVSAPAPEQSSVPGGQE